MEDRLVRTSKFLSYVLRHDPGALGLELDPGGWVEVETLIEKSRRLSGRSLSRSCIEHLLAAGKKTRFTLSEDDSKIRANYGHSIDVDLDLEPTPPPSELYHGTAEHTLSAIREEGLHPQSRQFVHLSSTREEAVNVGRRHGTPVVLIVEAQPLHDAGHTFYRSTDAVWLTDRVPPHFLRTPDE